MCGELGGAGAAAAAWRPGAALAAPCFWAGCCLPPAASTARPGAPRADFRGSRTLCGAAVVPSGCAGSEAAGMVPPPSPTCHPSCAAAASGTPAAAILAAWQAWPCSRTPGGTVVRTATSTPTSRSCTTDATTCMRAGRGSGNRWQMIGEKAWCPLDFQRCSPGMQVPRELASRGASPRLTGDCVRVRSTRGDGNCSSASERQSSMASSCREPTRRRAGLGAVLLPTRSTAGGHRAGQAAHGVLTT